MWRSWLIEQIRTIDLNGYAILLLMVILYADRFRGEGDASQTRIFKLLAWSTIGVLFLEILTWIADGHTDPGLRWLVYGSNYLYLLFSPLPAIAWINYFDYVIYGSATRLRKKWYYLQPYVLIVIMVLITPLTNFLFYVDDANVYHRQPGLYAYTAVSVTLIFLILIIALRNRNQLKKLVFGTMLFFSIIPIVGFALQVILFGVTAFWPSITLAILVSYVFLEIRRDTRDFLTGLLNRQQIEEAVSYRISSYKKNGGFALLMVDLDRFKQINDEHGHYEGDQALITVANLFIRSFKKRDRISRFGGDEFLILVDCDDEEAIQGLVKRVHEGIRLENEKSQAPYTISLSVGYTIFDPKRFSDLKSLYTHVDRQMYKMKEEAK